jgi:hypothetical protein
MVVTWGEVGAWFGESSADPGRKLFSLEEVSLVWNLWIQNESSTCGESFGDRF